MTTPYENFVNIALGKALSSDVTLPTEGEIPTYTGIGRQVTGKTLGELGIATTSALSGKEPTITVGTSSQYYRGDKSFQTLDADAVPETATRVYLSPTQKNIATQAASASLSGYLSTADWNTFNGKLKTINHTSAGTITLVPGYKVTQIISTAATMTLTGGVATDQSEIVRIIARADTTITLTGTPTSFADGYTLNNIGTTYTVYKGETIDLFMPAANVFFVHGQHIQDSDSLAIYKPTTNNKISFNLSALSASKTITFPDADVDLGTIVTAVGTNWMYGFGYAATALYVATPAGVTKSDLSAVTIGHEVITLSDDRTIVHAPRKHHRYILSDGVGTFTLDLTGVDGGECIEILDNSINPDHSVTLTKVDTTFIDSNGLSLGLSPATFRIQMGESIFITQTTSPNICLVRRSGNPYVASTGVSRQYRSRFVPPLLTADRTITVPDANVDLGDLPSVATTNNNVLSGTRTFCVMGGGSSASLGNKIQGTDTGAIGSTGCDMRGTRNIAYSSTNVGTAATATDNSFYNCSSSQPVELVTTIGVRYVNCSFGQLQATNSVFGGIWPNYSTVEATNEYGATKCTVGLTSINVDSHALTPLTTAGTGSTEVLAYKSDNYGIGISVHDIIITCVNYNETAGAVFRRTIVVNSEGTIVSATTPVPDVVFGSTVYTPTISVVGRILRITVASNISSDSAAYATVTSLYQ